MWEWKEISCFRNNVPQWEYAQWKEDRSQKRSLWDTTISGSNGGIKVASVNWEPPAVEVGPYRVRYIILQAWCAVWRWWGSQIQCWGLIPESSAGRRPFVTVNQGRLCAAKGFKTRMGKKSLLSRCNHKDRKDLRREKVILKLARKSPSVWVKILRFFFFKEVATLTHTVPDIRQVFMIDKVLFQASLLGSEVE